MDAKKAAELLDEYLHNELSPEKHAEVERLLEKDADLRGKRDDLRSYFEAIESLPSIQASDSFLEEVHRKSKRRRGFFTAIPLEIVGVAVTVGFLILIVNPFSPKVQNESRVVKDMIEAETPSEAHTIAERGTAYREPPGGKPAEPREFAFSEKKALSKRRTANEKPVGDTENTRKGSESRNRTPSETQGAYQDKATAETADKAMYSSNLQSESNPIYEPAAAETDVQGLSSHESKPAKPDASTTLGSRIEDQTSPRGEGIGHQTEIHGQISRRENEDLSDRQSRKSQQFPAEVEQSTNLSDRLMSESIKEESPPPKARARQSEATGGTGESGSKETEEAMQAPPPGITALKKKSYAGSPKSKSTVQSRRFSDRAVSKRALSPSTDASAVANAETTPWITVRLDKGTDLESFHRGMRNWAEGTRGAYTIDSRDSSHATAYLKLPAAKSGDALEFLDSLGTLEGDRDQFESRKEGTIEIRLHVVP